MSTTIEQHQDAIRRLDRVEFEIIEPVEAGALPPASSLHVGVTVGDEGALRYVAIDPTNHGLVVHTDIEGEDRRVPMGDQYVSPESRGILAAAECLRDVVNRTGSQSDEASAVARDVVDRMARKVQRYHRRA